jgi:hypothetical protein
LQGVERQEDIRRQVRDSQIILKVIVLSISFYGNDLLNNKIHKAIWIYFQYA